MSFAASASGAVATTSHTTSEQHDDPRPAGQPARLLAFEPGPTGLDADDEEHEDRREPR